MVTTKPLSLHVDAEAYEILYGWAEQATRLTGRQRLLAGEVLSELIISTDDSVWEDVVDAVMVELRDKREDAQRERRIRDCDRKRKARAAQRQRLR